MSHSRPTVPVSDSEWLSQAEPMVRHVVGRWCRSAILDRDDLAQLCRMRLLERKPEFDPAVREWPDWVFRVCEQCLRGVMRRESRRNALCRRVQLHGRSDDHSETLDSILADLNAEPPEDMAARNDDSDRLRRMVGGLGIVERRLVVRMFGLDGEPATETIASTAAHFGMPLSACRDAIQRALESVRHGLTEGCYADVA